MYDPDAVKIQKNDNELLAHDRAPTVPKSMCKLPVTGVYVGIIGGGVPGGTSSDTVKATKL